MIKNNLNFISIKLKKNYQYSQLDKKLLIASPSDFGFHNMRYNKNKLFFFDFEYFGLDDPCKLFLDFVFLSTIYFNVKSKKNMV